jgi:hypothetical protein
MSLYFSSEFSFSRGEITALQSVHTFHQHRTASRRRAGAPSDKDE